MIKSINFIAFTTPYPFHVMVSLGETDAQLGRKLKRYNKFKEKDYWMFKDDSQRGFYSMMSGNTSLIRIREFPKTNDDYAVIQHELFHAVFHIFNVIGLKLCKKSDEAFAYMIESLTLQIYNRISNHCPKP